MPTRHRFTVLAALALLCGAVPSPAADVEPVAGDHPDAVHRLIKPHDGESRWMRVPWLTSVWEARQRAAAEGKPIFIWAGSGGGPVGVC